MLADTPPSGASPLPHFDRRTPATNAGAASFESSIRTPIPPCINAFTGIFRHNKRTLPMWTKPAFTDLRIGFEVTMYFASR
ncbi:Pyrroloquinoline quinone biosynthesis protein A [Pseudomonas sp. 1 R 17]|nr:Pyrroloquinoline quinone biosynthesis protein A [Pseudomonas sp. 1 R 17]